MELHKRHNFGGATTTSYMQCVRGRRARRLTPFSLSLGHRLSAQICEMIISLLISSIQVLGKVYRCKGLPTSTHSFIMLPIPYERKVADMAHQSV